MLVFCKNEHPLFFITWQPRPISCDWLSSKIFNVRKLYFAKQQKIILSFKRCSLTLFWMPRLKLFSKPVRLLLHFLVFLSGRHNLEILFLNFIFAWWSFRSLEVSSLGIKMSAPRWLPIESNPDVMNKFLHHIGLDKY